MSTSIDNFLNSRELGQLNKLKLNSPAAIQNFLDFSISYCYEGNRSPLDVFRHRKGHCLDAGLLGAALLKRIGFPPTVMELIQKQGSGDDDHLLVIFQANNKYGAVAKSNYTGMRYRDPVYKTLRELAMSYFPFYFSKHRQKTLRAYSPLIDMDRFSKGEDWVGDKDFVDDFEQYLLSTYWTGGKGTPLLTEKDEMELSEVDIVTLISGNAGIDVF